MSNTELTALGGMALGFIVQWAKGPQKFPTWLAYVLVGIAATAIYVWMTPDFTLSATTWRSAVAGWLTFLMSARGWGSTARDAKIAPKTDSL